MLAEEECFGDVCEDQWSVYVHMDIRCSNMTACSDRGTVHWWHWPAFRLLRFPHIQNFYVSFLFLCV